MRLRQPRKRYDWALGDELAFRRLNQIHGHRTSFFRRNDSGVIYEWTRIDGINADTFTEILHSEFILIMNQVGDLIRFSYSSWTIHDRDRLSNIICASYFYTYNPTGLFHLAIAQDEPRSTYEYAINLYNNCFSRTLRLHFAVTLSPLRYPG